MMINQEEYNRIEYIGGVRITRSSHEYERKNLILDFLITVSNDDDRHLLRINKTTMKRK